MSTFEAIQRYSGNHRVIAKQTERTGWGLFAETDYQPGEVIFELDIHERLISSIVTWPDCFGPCFERCYIIVPDFGYCCNSDHPFWSMNHSCNPNAGFVNWGRIDNGKVPIVAHRFIGQGEQITADYAAFTTLYDGSPEGGPWEMSPCLCGEPNCRGKISGFEAIPLEIQRQHMFASSPTQGRVLAHVIHDLPELVAMLYKESPTLYAEYLSALENLYAHSTEFQKTIGFSQAPSPDHKREEVL